MARFLSATGTDKNSDDAFVARNFLLDEGVSRERVESYRRAGAVADHPSVEEWRVAHRRYILEEVHLAGPGDGPPQLIDPNDVDACPETFRTVDQASPFLRADLGLDLIRVESARSISSMSREPAGEIIRLGKAVAEKTATPAERRRLDDILSKWTDEKDLRPIFAGFWEDLQDLFGDTPNEDPVEWADNLRDRLGLADYVPDQLRGKIDIVVFRYRVLLIPKLPRTAGNVRLLLPPTVLDGFHSAAFCPAPRGCPEGHTVDLSGLTPLPRREVVHPSIRLGVDHVWRVGKIGRRYEWEDLGLARGLHLLALREASGRADYAARTDGDLL